LNHFQKSDAEQQNNNNALPQTSWGRLDNQHEPPTKMEKEENENEYIYKASMIVILLVDPKPVHGPGGVNSCFQK